MQSPALFLLSPRRDQEIEDLTRRALVLANRRMQHHGIHGPRTPLDYVVMAIERLHAAGAPLELGPLCGEVDRLIVLDAERTGNTEGLIH